MKKAIKSGLALFLAFVMVFGGAPAGALAELTAWLGGLTASAAHTWQVGDIGTFGSYPQTRVTDSALLTALNSQTLTWMSYGYYSGTGSVGSMTQSDYMKYADVTYGGAKYRAVRFTSYRPYYTGYTSSYTYQDDNGYSTNTTYWFKYEPLRWRVLDPAAGLVMCETLIDSQAYSNTTYYSSSTGEYYNNAACSVYANDYATSSVRTWLNGLFLQTAFTGAQQTVITTTTLDNSAWPGYSQYDSDATNDKLFFLSYNDSVNTSYGFRSSYSTNDTARRAQGSDYAKCQGLRVVSSDVEYYGNSYWFLRSPGHGSDSASNVGHIGYVYNHYNVSDTNVGIRPAFKISNLSFLTLTSTETVPVTGITLSSATLPLQYKASGKLTVTFSPANATNKNVTWTSSDEKVATVDENGSVTARGTGTATVTATAQDGGHTATCTVTVSYVWWQWLIIILLFGWAWY